MSKLVICCDGTRSKNRGPSEIESLQDGSVFQLYNAIDDSEAIEKYYQITASAEGLLGVLVSNAIGLGLQDDVLECYQWLIEHYQPGDQLYLFGFGQGAWTIRTLAAMVSHYGIPRLSDEDDSSALALLVYKNGYRKVALASALPVSFHPGSNDIRFCAIWERQTNSLTPDQEPLRTLLRKPERYAFHTPMQQGELSLISPLQQEACSPPILPEIEDSDSLLEQLIRAAAGAELPFFQHVLKQTDFSASGSTDREPRKKPLKTAPLSTPDNWEWLDNATAPIEAMVQARQPWNWTGIYLEAGQRYRFSARGRWRGSHLSCGPDGAESQGPALQAPAASTPSLLQRVEQRWRRFTGESSLIPEPSARRVECANWFALIGVIATSAETDVEPGNPSMTTFEIGNGCELECNSSGYLYCFANDAWGLYDNNHGEVMLSIERM